MATTAGNVELHSGASAPSKSMWEDQSAFDYDYETLRTTGVILAVVMFVAGILIALNQVLWNGFSPPKQKYPVSQYRD